MDRQPKVAIALTSFSGPFYEDGDNTGAYALETIHPFKVFRFNGYQVDFISESGSYGWDDKSITKEILGDDKLYFEKDTEFNQALKEIRRAADIDPGDYDIIYFAGGHGCCFDFPKANDLKVLAAEIHNNNGVVAAVCHGPMIFHDCHRVGSTKPLIEGRSMTGFTGIGEKLLKVDGTMQQLKLDTVEDMAARNGAKFLSPVGPWDDYTVEDERILTGVNPQSAASLACRCIKVLEQIQASK